MSFKSTHNPRTLERNSKFYIELRRKHIIRLVITYLIPLIILTFYFQLHYSTLSNESLINHLRIIAESQSKTLDLFIREREVNLDNIIDDPDFKTPPSNKDMNKYLQDLKKVSEAFIDIGYFDENGVQAEYAGPLSTLEKRDYSNEQWYIELRESPDRTIITDKYLGFRKEPHFTIAVSRYIGDKFLVLRATLDPQKIYEYISSMEKSSDVAISIINNKGQYQVAKALADGFSEESPFLPPQNPWIGSGQIEVDYEELFYSYAWLETAEWAVIALERGDLRSGTIYGVKINIAVFAFVLFTLVLSIIIIRAKSLAVIQYERDIAESQLEQAAKLASIGELASGIAHEINNPLAIIASETGLMNDLMDPEFQENVTVEDFKPHLGNIREATYRCRNITRKLLSFVRKSDVELRDHDIHEIINETIEGLIRKEMTVSNIRIIKDYYNTPIFIKTDSNQIQQVLLNLINNAEDSIKPPGSITIKTMRDNKTASISITDTGCGMTEEQMEKIFFPFYTTKEVGKGTGLGLSVSYGIIKGFGGKIDVQSQPGKGSTFIIKLPIK